MIKPVPENRLATTQALWIIFSRDMLLVRKSEDALFQGYWNEISLLAHHQSSIVELPALSEHHDLAHPVFLLDLGAEHVEHELWEFTTMRSVMAEGSEALFNVLSRAWQYVHFLRTHRYCGQCGAQMEQVDWEMAMQCHQCKHRAYPRVSPCIIVGIYRDNQILLAKGVRHKESGMYSTLAGFVESGESLEQAVHREVEEEVGVKIKNLSYFNSQPWPFPHSLMMGFLAEYDSGDIVPQPGEIDDAQWFDIDNLPKIPPKLSIAGKLIEAMIQRDMGNE
ncbi:NAD(+) diphosphatase [Alteromonas confluentis]|uniref:NAD-capped RNA hydrolase NudC n=1 Tax=Alteromonas confluentis TaxID=1656094 RepID=A0A1E7Z9E8_9ALTE|nr:NAD(+) diphosphatase [Alteromonas confluentis]OFC70150.1 NADH pyrophosphatase [Alteromonas confluentis]